MRVLVTGGAGYVGSHTCKALARARHIPITFDNLSTGHRDAVKWGSLVVADLLDRDALFEAFRVHEPQAVLHFAALAYVGASVTSPEEYYRVNVVGTHNLLDAMIASGCRRIVFSSTCATYGVPESCPITEQTPQRPINPYGFSKLVVEQMLSDYRNAGSIESVSLRYFNAAGADPDGELRERHEPETHAVPLALAAATGGGAPFKILGTEYPTPDGTAIRDYVHVSDLARAHVDVIERLGSGSIAPAYNLGTGTGVSVLEMLAAVERVTGNVVPTVKGEARQGDPPTLYASAELAKRDLGWVPRFSTIDEIIATAATLAPEAIRQPRVA